MKKNFFKEEYQEFFKSQDTIKDKTNGKIYKIKREKNFKNKFRAIFIIIFDSIGVFILVPLVLSLLLYTCVARHDDADDYDGDDIENYDEGRKLTPG